MGDEQEVAEEESGDEQSAHVPVEARHLYASFGFDVLRLNHFVMLTMVMENRNITLRSESGPFIRVKWAPPT